MTRLSRIPSIQWFDEKTHPRSLVAFCHRHHDVTRLAVDLCPFILRRKGKLELIEEGNDHNLHLEDSMDSSVTEFCMALRTINAFGDGTYENRQPTHARVPLAMPVVIASEESMVWVSALSVLTEVHPTALY